MPRKINFYRHAFLLENNDVLRTAFLKIDSDEMLKLVFTFKTAAADMVHASFELYASSSNWCLILLRIYVCVFFHF